MVTLEEKIRCLDPSLLEEVDDFVTFLLEKHGRKTTPDVPSFSWAGGLRELRDRYTSVELQHAISRMRSQP